jgi:hypothetical protein
MKDGRIYVACSRWWKRSATGSGSPNYLMHGDSNVLMKRGRKTTV